MGKNKHSIRFSRQSSSGYLPGSLLSGSVTFDITSPTPGYEVRCYLSGQEYACVMYTTTSHTGKSSRTMTHYDKADRNLVKASIPLKYQNMIQGGNIKPGVYVLPFEVRLPQKCPPSMKYGLGSSECSVNYHISAYINKKKGGMPGKHSITQSFTVRGFPLSAQPCPFLGEPEKKDVLFCCCDRGYMLFGARASDTLLDQGEQMDVGMSCRNHTISSIKDIKAKFIETVKWQARSHSKDFSRTLVEEDFPLVPSTNRLKEKGASKGLDAYFREMSDELASGKHSASITCPLNSIPNFKGKLIRVTHHIEIKVQTGMCVTNPVIRIPVRVGPSRPDSKKSTMKDQPEMQEDGAISASKAVVGQSDFKFGGATRTLTENGENVTLDDQPNENVVPPSFDNLIKEMNVSLDDYDIICDKMKIAEWMPVFESLTSKMYGQIIKEVDYAFEQGPVAELIAKKIKNFTCTHVVAALTNCFQWSKCSIVDKLLIYVTDLKQNEVQILNCLSDWEKINTEAAFRNAHGSN